MQKKEQKKQEEEKNDAPTIEKNLTMGEVEDVDTKELLEKNLKWSQLIYEQNKRIQYRLTMMVIGSYIKIAIIVVPLILAAIYLPPIAKDAFAQYQSLIGIGGGDQVEDVASVISNLTQDQKKIISELLNQE